ARIVDLVELVPTAELGADRVPQQLHDLDALAVVDVVRAADIFGEILVDRGIVEVLRGRREINERGGDDLLDDLLHAPVGVAGEYAIARAGLRIRQHRAAAPRHRIHRHRIRDRPEKIAPRDDLAEHRLIAAEFIRASDAQRLRDQADEEIELHGETRAA